MMPYTKDAYDLLHQGALALAEVEHHGLKIDVEYLRQAREQAGKDADKLERKLYKDDTWRLWEKEFGVKAKLGAPAQLGHVFFNVLKYPCQFKTAKDKMSAKEEAFQDIDTPFKHQYFEWKGLLKMQSTYLKNIEEELDGKGFLHPVFNLHTVTTIRGSCSLINFQNIPIRDPVIGKVIRSCFVPRKGRRLVEIDFGSLEFNGAACFWKDPGMVEYASDPDKDIHRDMSAECYLCPKDQVHKDTRYCGKNKLVFPILYGSYWRKCAANLWEAIQRMNLQLNDGTPMRKHLRKKGVRELGCTAKGEKPAPGTFEYVIYKVEERFNKRFPLFGEGKERWWKEYCKRGWFQLMTGFVISGIYSRNFLMNCPIQGPMFHVLLWCLIRVQKILKKRKMKSLIVGQIHDCILGDVPDDEVQEFLDICEKVMTVDVRKHWDWIIVPLKVEVDVTPLREEGGTWHAKAPWTKVDGKWVPKPKKEAA